MSSTSMFSVGPTLDQIDEGFRAIYPKFSAILDAQGMSPRFFFRQDLGATGSLIAARSIILDSTADLGQEGGAIRDALHHAVAFGARVLCSPAARQIAASSTSSSDGMDSP